MNSLCEKTLLGFKDHNIDSPTDCLIDKIVTFKGDVKDLSFDALKEDVSIAEEGQDEIRDFRICNMSFRNFRTFPKHDLPYGIEFAEPSGEPCSLFLVGKNGTGKSTIFDALEWIYAGRVSNAEDRGVIKRDNIFEYLTYGFNHVPNISPDSVELKTRINGDGILRYEWKKLKELRPLCVPAICCSDMDIEEIAKLSEEGGNAEDGEFQRFVRKQLGYEDLTILKERLLVISNDIQRSVERLQRRKRLANLSSSDIIKLIGIFEKLYVDGIVKISNWIGRILRFSDINQIETIINHERPSVLLGSDNYCFVDDWEELLQNVVKMRAQIEEELTENPYLDPDIADMGQENHDSRSHADIEGLKSQISIIKKHLSAMYKRLEEAYDSSQDDSHGNGLARAMVELQKDYDFLVSESSTLPKGEMDIDRKLVSIRNIAEPIPELINRIEIFFSHLFEVAVDTNEGDATYQSKYPRNLNTFIMDVLNHYREKGETFNVKVKSNSFEVIIEVKDSDGRHFETSPRNYLNTFRFRLFAVLLKIALAFYYMKENNCIAPIIIDDVFNASDFENSVSLNTFIFTIFDVYQKLLGGEKPLQLIILTHDEMIANAFRQGVKMRSLEMMERIRNNTKIATPDQYCIFGRLFHYLESGEVNKVEDRDRNFLNLYLKTNF